MMIDLRYHSERNGSLVLRRHAYLPVFISVLQVDPLLQAAHCRCVFRQRKMMMDEEEKAHEKSFQQHKKPF